MSRTNGEGRLKKRNCCLTCSIVCFIILVIFFAALYIGGFIMFKTYVSPQIGGLDLNDAIALAANVFSGKEAKTTYTDADLDSFYSGLSDAMFLSDKTENELEYELVPEDARRTLAASAPAVSAAEAESSSEEYDEDLAYTAFCLKSPSERYALLSDETRALLSLEEFSALAGTSDAALSARQKVGLKTYRLSIDAVMKDMKFGAEDFDAGKALEKSLSSLEFNFDSLENYDIDNAAAEQNEKFTTFSVNGDQASAFINDVIDYLLSAENSPLTSTLKDSIPVDVPLADYVTVASVTIMNTPLATNGGEAIYDQKDTALGVAISIRLRDIVKASLETEELKSKLQDVPDFAVQLIPSLVPQFFSANLTVFPLAPSSDGREIAVSINQGSEKNSERLATLVNALLGKEDTSRTFFGTVNDKIVDVFSSINKTVKINFVPTKDSDNQPLKDEKGNTYSSMKIMTWQTVLSLIDKEGRLSAHDVLTMLKCLYISKDPHSEINTDDAMDTFKDDMSTKYGVEKTYLDEHNILSTSDLSGLPEHIVLKNVTLGENEEMRVNLSAEVLAAFMAKYISKDESEGAETPTETAASEEESSSSDILKGLDLTITDVTIDKVSEGEGVDIYSFELGILVNLEKLLEDKLPTEGISATLSKKLLPKNDAYFCVMLYISEYVDAETGKLTHKVGAHIDEPAEGQTSAYLSKIRINDFSYADTTHVFDALDTFMQVLSGNPFDVTSITASLEDAVDGVFTSIAGNKDFSVDLRLYEQDAESGSRGGLTMPSIYELMESLVKPKLEGEETFTTSDAKDVLYTMYHKEVNMDKTFNTEEDQDQAEDFLDDVNDKYYIVKDSALTVSDLFGDKVGNLANKLKVNSIYFKYDAAEAAKWTGEKKALYSDDRSAEALRITLNGSEIAALVKDSNMLPSDMISSFGTMEILGASFKTEDDKTFLSFNIKLIFNKEAKEGEESGDTVKYGNLFPEDGIKLTAKIRIDDAASEEERYRTTIKLNDDESAKAFLMLRALGGSDLSEQSIADKITDSVKKTFTALEEKIPLYYSDGGSAYTDETDDECILVADIFTFLVKQTKMKDVKGMVEPAEDASEEEKAAYAAIPEEEKAAYAAVSFTDPQKLAERLRAFGQQAKSDADLEDATYSWVNGLNLFTADDDDYIYTNMQRAYFLINAPTLDDIYGSGNFAGKFGTISDTNFNLNNDLNGLYYYDGDIMTLKVSEKALGVIISEKQQSTITAAVSGKGMNATIKSLKIYEHPTKSGTYVMESGILITFVKDPEAENQSQYDYHSTMPVYFFAIAKTECTWNGSNYECVTSVTINNATDEDTELLFTNISYLGSQGMNVTAFDKDTIEGKINHAITDALTKLPSNVSFGEFDSSLSSEYNATNYGASTNLPVAGAGYISFPSVYYYMIDNLITKPEAKTGLTKPENVTEIEMRDMIVHLHAADENVTIGKTCSEEVSDLITNPKNTDATHIAAFKGSNYITDAIVIASDRYLAGEISDRFAGITINGNLSLEDALQQTILLRALAADETHSVRDDWESSFYSSGTYIKDHNYMIATAVVDLDSTIYKTGKTSILPEKLWFTVLADLDGTTNSKGLLYNMSHRDMEIFEFILAQNSTSSFKIDSIAKDFADQIVTAVNKYINKLSTDYLLALNIEYHLASDDYTYYASSTATDPEDELHANTYVQAPMTDGKPNGVGYIVLSA